MPFVAVPTSTWVATFSACHSWICALLAMEMYSRREGQGFDAYRTKRAAGREDLRLSPARIRAFYQPAAVVCRGLLCLLCLHLHCYFFSSGMEPGRPPFRKLR